MQSYNLIAFHKNLGFLGFNPENPDFYPAASSLGIASLAFTASMNWRAKALALAASSGLRALTASKWKRA